MNWSIENKTEQSEDAVLGKCLWFPIIRGGEERNQKEMACSIYELQNKRWDSRIRCVSKAFQCWLIRLFLVGPGREQSVRSCHSMPILIYYLDLASEESLGSEPWVSSRPRTRARKAGPCRVSLFGFISRSIYRYFCCRSSTSLEVRMAGAFWTSRWLLFEREEGGELHPHAD